MADGSSTRRVKGFERATSRQNSEGRRLYTFHLTEVSARIVTVNDECNQLEAKEAYRGAAHTFYPDATAMSELFEWRGGCRVVKIRGMDYDERIDFVIEMLNQKITILRGAMEGCNEYPRQKGNYLYSKRLCACIGCYNWASRYSKRAKANNLPRDLCKQCKTGLDF